MLLKLVSSAYIFSLSVALVLFFCKVSVKTFLYLVN